VHSEELSGDLGVAVKEYRAGRVEYSAAFEFIVDIYREELENWIIENKLLSVQLKYIK